LVEINLKRIKERHFKKVDLIAFVALDLKVTASPGNLLPDKGNPK
jgi:hypothetical protein